MSTSRRLLSGLILGSLSLVSLVGCGGDDSLGPGAECDPHYYLCQEGLVCAELVTGGNRCFGELVLSGEVTDTSDGSAVEGAQVMVLNEEGIAVTDVARTDGMGTYHSNVPAKRNADGSPAGTYTLRAAAQDYQAFPSGARVALPIDLGDATSLEGRYTLDSALTHVGLIPLGVAERSSMSGSITKLGGGWPGDNGGVLVVASGANGAFSGLSDKAGNFTIFNLPAGDYEFRAYAVDMQNESVNVTVGRDPLSGLTLVQQPQGLATVAGSVQLVNAPGGALTSVILVVEDTFDPLAARGEAPRGLRSPRTGPPDVSGNFSISGVPAGRYVVLVAHENDDLVRDPNTTIAGTGFVTVDVTAGGTNVDLTESFEVMAALPTNSPGAEAPEAVTAKPELVWGDDSSEIFYDVRVFDAFGDEVWNSFTLPGVSGSATASVQYTGPLEPGMYYQFRVTSWGTPGGKDPAPIAATEDQRGVFYLPAP